MQSQGDVKKGKKILCYCVRNVTMASDEGSLMALLELQEKKKQINKRQAFSNIFTDVAEQVHGLHCLANRIRSCLES
jgi:hypothetical protein